MNASEFDPDSIMLYFFPPLAVHRRQGHQAERHPVRPGQVVHRPDVPEGVVRRPPARSPSAGTRSASGRASPSRSSGRCASPTTTATTPCRPGWDRLPIVEVDGQPVIPLRQGEALWLAFDGEDWHPNAVQVAVGGVNVLTGGPFDDGLGDDPQNYLVTPHQPWLDGIKTGDGVVRQFIAAPLDTGVTVEGQVTGRRG